MLITVAKGQNEDLIMVTRPDGSGAQTRVPRKGPVPHDAAHFHVERALGFTDAFWGMIAAGSHPQELGELARAFSHPSASRAGSPGPMIRQLVQAERVVEAFEAQLWAGGGDLAGLLSMLEPGCAASLVPVPAITRAQHGVISEALARLAAGWVTAPIGHLIALEWTHR